MKKTIIILLVCVFLLSGGLFSSSSAETDEYADQTAFLRDMAAGITQRLNDDKDSSQMTAKEKAEYYLTLVGYELDRIEKYETQVFEDSVFNDLAHLYIDACQTQRFAAQNYKNSALYDALWEGGRKTRSAIIVELYSRYDLPITSEQAAQYAPSTSYTINYSLDSSNEKKDVDLDEVKKQIEFTCFNLHTEKYINADPRHFILIQAKNNSKYAVSVAVNVIFYNQGTVVDACDAQFYYCTTNEWYAYEVSTEKEYTDIKLEITSIERNKALDDYQLSDIVTISETRSGKNVLVSSKNKLNKEVSLYGYVVFFNNDTVVDCKSFSFDLDAGMESIQSCTTRHDYTRYKICMQRIWYKYW